MATESEDDGILGQIGGDTDARGVEDRMASGGTLPKGFYHAKLNGAKRVQAKEKEDGTPGSHGHELTFYITEGPYQGREVTDKIWISDKQASRDRIKLWGHRLGLLVKSKDGGSYEYAPGKKEFLDVLDAEIVLEITHQADDKDASKMWPRFAFGGAHDPKDVKIAAIMKNGGRPLKTDEAAKPGEKKATADAPPAKKRTAMDKL